jgi:hypothetical protein
VCKLPDNFPGMDIRHEPDNRISVSAWLLIAHLAQTV